MTQNHNYNQPAEGTKDWHIPLNNNFSKFDTDIEIRDSEANLGDYTPKSGSKFVAIDTGNVFVGDGSNWSQLGTIDRRVVDPSKDGSGIQQAADQLSGAGIIQLKEGNYTVDSQIKMKDGQELVGAGMHGTTLTATSNISAGMLTGGEKDNGLSVRHLTIDMDNQGHSAIFFFIADRCWIHRVRALNAGSRSGGSDGGILLRNSFDNDGFDNIVTNCVARNCSNVSIDVGAGGTDPARAIVYGNKIYNPDGNQQFTHGISVENVDHSVVMGNTAIENDGNGPRWSPAYNINAAANVSVVGNTAQNVVKGISTANGPSTGNQYHANTIYNFTDKGLNLQNSGAGTVTQARITGNTFNATGNDNAVGVTVGGTCHGDIVGNTFLNMQRAIGIAGSELSHNGSLIQANKIKDCTDSAIKLRETQNSDPYVIVGNQLTAPNTSPPNPPINTAAQEGTPALITDNVITYAGSGFGRSVESSIGSVINDNYLAGGIRASSGIIRDNIVGGRINVESGTLVENNHTLSTDQQVSGAGQSYRIGGARKGSYTGDGSQDRKISCYFEPEYVIVKSKDSGTLYDVHAQFGTGFNHKSPSGTLSLSSSGFLIGAESGSSDPNADGLTYESYAR